MSYKRLQTVVQKALQRYQDSSIVLNKDLGVAGGAYFTGIKECGGIMFSPTRMLHDCAAYNSGIFGTWTETSNSNFDVANNADGPATDNVSISLTLGTAATSLAANARIYVTPTTPLDLRPYKYIGMFVKSGSGDTWVAGELVFELYGSGNTAFTGVGGHLYKSANMPASSGNIWEYYIIDISGYDPELLKKVTRFGFRHASGGSDSDILYVALIEAGVYKYGAAATLGACGLVKGPIEYKYVQPDAAAIASGDAVICTNTGYVKVAAANTDEYFCGIALDSVDASAEDSAGYGGPRLIAVQTGGVVNRKCNGIVTAGVMVELDGTTPKIEIATADDEYGCGIPLQTTEDNEVVPILLRPGLAYYTA